MIDFWIQCSIVYIGYFGMSHEFIKVIPHMHMDLPESWGLSQRSDSSVDLL